MITALLLLSKWARVGIVLGVATVLVACAGSEKAKMADLVANPSLLGVKTAWSSNVGSVNFVKRGSPAGGISPGACLGSAGATIGKSYIFDKYVALYGGI